MKLKAIFLLGYLMLFQTMTLSMYAASESSEGLDVQVANGKLLRFKDVSVYESYFQKMECHLVYLQRSWTDTYGSVSGGRCTGTMEIWSRGVDYEDRGFSKVSL